MTTLNEQLNKMKGWMSLLENDSTTGKTYPPIPDLVYHGQPPKYDNKGNRTEPVKFDKFDQNQKRFLQDGHYGFYFTADKREARDYAEGGNVYTCKLHVKNTYYFENIYNYNNQGLIKGATFIDAADKEKLEANGYDSVVLLTFMGRVGEIIALYPEQIEIVSVE